VLFGSHSVAGEKLVRPLANNTLFNVRRPDDAPIKKQMPQKTNMWSKFSSEEEALRPR
jgi:hypothetical protein